MKSPQLSRRAVSRLVLGAAALPLSAQIPAAKAEQGGQTDDPQSRITLDVTRVNILFTVTDKKGRFVTNLTKNDFTVYENKKKQNILEFTSESDLPLRLGLLIDTSNSIRDRFRFEQEASIEFLHTLMRPRTDRALIVSFDTAAEMASDLTDDQEKLIKTVRDLRPGGGTALYDAIFVACRDRLMMDQPRHKFRRALVILSDGDDNQSRYTREQALEMAQKADVVIYTVSTNISRIQSDGDKVLRYLAAETGGISLFPFKVEDLSQSFENIANELRSQYNMLYRPEPLQTDGLFHTIKIEVANRREFVVHARRGYFAPKL
jgi:VWFA-related protein